MFSYIFSGGKCGHCKKKISPTYLFLEICTGISFVAAYNYLPFYHSSTNTIIAENLPGFLLLCTLFALMVGIFFYDLAHKQIPDLMLFPFIAIALVTALVLGQSDYLGMIIAVVLALVMFGGQIIISKGAWLGEGDLYFAIGMALLFSWQNFLLSVAISYFVGALISIILLMNKKAAMKTKIPFAPFLVMGTFFTFFMSETILQWYFSFSY